MMENLQDKYSPNAVCFGCGPANPKGLHIKSRPEGDHLVADWLPEPQHMAFAGFKSNLEEAAHATGMAIVNETSLRNLGVNLLSRLECRAILLTRGEQGVTLFDTENVTLFPPISGKKNLFDKVGVRDAMTGVFAMTVASGGSAYQATVLSDVAGGARSELQRNVPLSLHDLEVKAQGADDFVHRIVQAPVRR